MDKPEYERLLKLADQRRVQKKQKAEDEWLADTQAIERVWSMQKIEAMSSVLEGLSEPALRARKTTVKSFVSKVGPADAVRSALHQMPERFSVRELFDVIHKGGTKINQNAISSVLNKFKTRGEVVQVEAGHGKRAAIYKLPKQGSPRPDRGFDFGHGLAVATGTAT